MEYNTEEIKRFGVRLEEQASNFQVSTDNIDYDFRKICSILNKYKDEAHQKYSSTANEFGDGWLGQRVSIKSDILRLSAGMLGFYEATSANAAMQTAELEQLKKGFVDYYKEHPEVQRENSNMYWTDGGRAGWGPVRPNYEQTFKENMGFNIEDL